MKSARKHLTRSRNTIQTVETTSTITRTIGISLSIYLRTTATILGAMLAKKIRGEEKAIYYVSKSSSNVKLTTCSRKNYLGLRTGDQEV